MGASGGVTATLCEAIVELAAADLPEEVLREGRRGLLNVLGTAIGASRSDAVRILLANDPVARAAATTPVPGRPERAGRTTAAVAIGTAAHYDDYDDTHLETVIHPGASMLASVWSLGAEVGASGRDALTAFVLGIEAQLRVGAAMSPWHYDAGWHITGTCGVIGAAVGAGLLLGLDAGRLEQAVGIAASQTLGVREAFGTMTKPLHPGRAAANGLMAATLAARGFEGPTAVLERDRGYFAALSARHEPGRVVDGLGRQWEILANTYKPYPCGIVCHPAIEAGERCHGRIADPGRVADVRIVCNPLVVELTGNPTPTDGLEAKFSTIHGVVAGLLDGRVGLAQYRDDYVRRADVARLRRLARLDVDERIARDAAQVVVTLHDGGEVVAEVDHAQGSRERPLSDEALLAKVEALVHPVLGDATARLRAAVDDLADAPDLTTLIAACTPPAPARDEATPRSAGADMVTGARGPGSHDGGEARRSRGRDGGARRPDTSGVSAALVAFAHDRAPLPDEVAAAARARVAAVIEAARAGASTAVSRTFSGVVAVAAEPPRVQAIGWDDALDPATAAAVTAMAATIGAGTPDDGRARAADGGRDEARLGAAVVPQVGAAWTSGVDVAVVAVALAVGELVAAGEDAVVDAVARGVEAAHRVATGMHGHEDRGWDAAGTTGQLGGAVAALRLVGVAGTTAQEALGIAATQAAGLRAAAGTPTAALHVARAAHIAVESVLLAIGGFSGPPAGIEGRRGIATVLAGRPDADAMVDGLGARWRSVAPPGPLVR